MNPENLAMFGLPGGTEWIVIVLVALLLFGRRLPDVARSLGKSIVEFKRGVRDVKEDVETRSRLEGPEPTRLESKPENHDGPAAPESSGAAPESSQESSATPR